MVSQMFESESFSLSPVHFFALSCDCRSLKNLEETPSLGTHALPLTHSLTGEEAFAHVAMGWHEEGISVLVDSNHPALESIYPSVEQGDSVELFFDTRDVKSSGFNTRFCHHFFFLAEAVEGVLKGEKTHFRTEDRHPLCDPEQLSCKTSKRKNQYSMRIIIPRACLHGYDPKQFDRLGFTYRINRARKEAQHFSVVSQEYAFEQLPSLWASLKLI